MRRRIRPLPLLLVVLAHGLMLGLVLIERHFRPQQTTAEQLVYILPITSPQNRAQAVATPEVRVLPQTQRRQPESPPEPLTVPPADTFEPAPITPEAPRVDWQRELELSAHSFGQPEEPATQYRSLDDKPKALELPPPVDGPVSGEVVLLPNGDRQVSYDAGDNTLVCTSPQVALDEAFSIWAKFRPPRCAIKAGKKKDRIPEPRPRSYLSPSASPAPP
jgi:hypothetical protein